jgi:hypothetical protein
VDIKRIIEIMSTLPEDAGLAYPENWDDAPETQKWAEEACEACKEVVRLLKNGKTVGTLTIKNKTYSINE